MRRAIAAVLAAALIASIAAPAYAATEAQLRARLQQLKSQTAAAGRSYDRAYWALQDTDGRIRKTQKRLDATSKELKKANKRLMKRANGMYRQDKLDTLALLVGARSFEDFVTRADYLARLGVADARDIARAKALKARLLAQRATLRSERKRRRANVTSLRARRNTLQRKLRSTQAQFVATRAALDAIRSPGGHIPGGVAAMPGPNGLVFPVVGSYFYANTWGASRSGGRRRHQGTDIMARRGTRIVAVTSGTVRASNNGLGGRCIWLRGSNGWSFYYAHLDRWIVRSGRVRAGQVIATVGSTGNAAGGAPHLHFQIHPGGGRPINPYPYLRRAE
jgi:murein DD-endopeptidase MepM/ murein hydrolase activator NlpD